jgi:hypothetical protein
MGARAKRHRLTAGASRSRARDGLVLGSQLSRFVAMPDRRLLTAIGAVIALPILFASIGAGRGAGLAIGVVLVAVGVGSMLVSNSRGRDDR